MGEGKVTTVCREVVVPKEKIDCYRAGTGTDCGPIIVYEKQNECVEQFCDAIFYEGGESKVCSEGWSAKEAILKWKDAAIRFVREHPEYRYKDPRFQKTAEEAMKKDPPRMRGMEESL